MKNNSAIVLLSGGLDSLVSLASVQNKFEKILALTFNYGQKAWKKELEASSKISQYYKIEHKIIELPWLNDISSSSLNKDYEIPSLSINQLDDINIAEKTAKDVWVPNRNGLFVNIAASFADALKYNYIVIGANIEEGRTFKDNTIEFVNSLNNSLKNSTAYNVQLIAPLIEKSKNEIVKLGIDLNIPFHLLNSCYSEIDIHCGKCESCMRLIRALKYNHRDDLVKILFNQAG